MANSADQLPPSALAERLEMERSATSTFSKDTVSVYAQRVRASKPEDSEFIQLVPQAVNYLSIQDSGDTNAMRRPNPIDLASALEIWQESDRKDMDPSTEQFRGSHFTDRQTLLEALNKQSSQTGFSTAPRYLALPTPYLPCMVALQDLERVDLPHLELASHNRGKSVDVARVGPLVRLHPRVICAVVDRSGNAMLVELTCTDSEFEADVLRDGATLAIKEPFVTTGRNAAWCIRVDQPSDLVKILDPGGSKKTTGEWKEHGNSLFRQRRLGDAAAAYENGLEHLDADNTAMRDLHRNLAQCCLSLGFWDRAKDHADKALDLLGPATESSTICSHPNGASTVGRSEIPPEVVGSIKALYRGACAAYAMQDFASARDNLHRLLKLAPQHVKGRRELLWTYKRLNEEQHGAYDFDEILSQTSPQQPQVDAANFTTQTIVSQSAGRGNGLFAANDLGIGDLILCEKALAADFSSSAEEPVRTYDTSRELFSATPRALWVKIAQKVVKNPSLAMGLLRLGGHCEGIRSQEIYADGTRIIDVFQVHDIVARNSFGIPTPCPDAKSEQWGVYTSQSGAHGGTTLAPRNSAIFCYAAFINHSCLSNVEKRFIGDLIILRATRPIAKGEEILLDYAPGELHDVRSQKAGFERSWQFACDCQLCAAESKQSDDTLDRRISLTQEVNELSEELSLSISASIHRDAAIGRTERLAKQLKATYSQSELQKSLAYTYTTLALLYGARKQNSKQVQSIKDGFESLGWRSPLETAGTLLPKSRCEPATVLDLNVPQLLYMACSAASATGHARTVQGIKNTEPQVYLALNGTMHGFKSIEERMRS